MGIRKLGDEISLTGDRGRKRLSPSPPSEPCVRFSRTRLSRRWFPHRDWLASFAGCSHGEQSLGREECIGPALMILSTNSHARSLLLLSKYRPQPSTHKAIHPLKGIRMSMLEIVKPTTKRRIHISDNVRQNCRRAYVWSSSECDLAGPCSSFCVPSAAPARNDTPESQSPVPVADNLPPESCRH